MTATDTAHHEWDAAWRDPARRAEWETPEPSVIETATALRLRGAETALDLGAGVGRHALALARLGFRTTALDASASGLALIRDRAEAAGIALDTVAAPMTALPLPDASMDYVLSWNVIYHGDPGIVRAAIAEIARVLKSGGVYQGTMLTLRNRHFGRGEEIAPRTWIDPSAGGDKGHPHFYCDAGELAALFSAFEPLSLVQDEHDKPRNWHWRLIAERR